ncbi:hypothetical protein L195_g063901, partial [Trifolium pratense]
MKEEEKILVVPNNNKKKSTAAAAVLKPMGKNFKNQNRTAPVRIKNGNPSKA